MLFLFLPSLSHFISRVVAQQQILQEQPVSFVLPKTEFVALLFSSVLMSLIAVIGPVRSMLQRSIVDLLR